jgi:aerobic carbon-monoxide dehydrogenase medium subunit
VVSAADFSNGFLETVLGPDEMLTEIRVPTGLLGWGYEKFTRRAIDWATVAVAVARRDSGTQVALANMGATVLRARGVEEALAGGAGPADAATHADEGTSPGNDVTASSDYRRHLARILTERALSTVGAT